MPAARIGVSLSSLVKTCATRTVNNGVVAFRIEATPEAIWLCPQTISENGIALLSTPMPRKASHTVRSRGSDFPAIRIAACSTSAAMATRENTITKGGNSRTATPLKKNDPPHRTESAISIAHSAGVIDVRVGGISVSV